MKTLLATTAFTLGITSFAWADEAPTGFDNLTNGFIDQPTFDADRAVFEDVETPADGLGPTFNNSSCRNCHDTIVTGGSGSITELRAGSRRRHGGTIFVEAAGGTLIQSQALDPSIVESVRPKDNVTAFRITTNILGEGFVEAVLDQTLLAIRDQQPPQMKGLAVMVNVLEIPGVQRVGRFGWKDQHASLKSFAADAYLNEMGITTPLFPVENTSNGRSVAAFDAVPDPEDDGTDVNRFADFMRATKAPPRNQLLQTTKGEVIFTQIQCAVCHTPSMTTASALTVLPGQLTPIGTALGGKTIHPYSDFLLHDVGTGDGIPMNSDHPETSFTMRTAPLWGLRTRNQLMHDGGSISVTDAIDRHDGQAKESRDNFDALNEADKIAILTFLNSL
jgi:CxxC motif-containing protein (DUF1111 family)